MDFGRVMFWLGVSLVGLMVAVPLCYFVWRSVGKSIGWRFWPGWSRITHEAGMERYPDCDDLGRWLAYEVIPQNRFVIRLRDLGTGQVQTFGATGGNARYPELSGDGSQLSFREYSSGVWPDAGKERPGRTVSVVLRPGSTPNELARKRMPDCSADGRFCVRADGEQRPVKVVVSDGVENAETFVGFGFSPVLSANGRFVAFDTVDDAFDLVIVDLVNQTRTVACRGNPYPYQARFLGSLDELVVCCGHLNPLSRTGDTDLFRINIARLHEKSWAPCPIAWRPTVSGPLTAQQHPQSLRPRSGSAEIAGNSVWTAGWYFQEDGTLKEMREQDGDGIQVYSQRLARFVDQVREATGAPRVNLVCHCMGGLVAKGMLQYWHDDEYGFCGLDGTPGHTKVQHIVTLASPLRGNSLFGLLPTVRALRIPYYRMGFTRQAYDMTRGSEFLARLNQGELWDQRVQGWPASCYKPVGRSQPPFYHSFTGDGYGFMDGAVTHDATRCVGMPGSDVLLSSDEEAIVYETADGLWATDRAVPAGASSRCRRMVHVPEDVVADYVTEDKCKALTRWILDNLEPDLPIVFVHGSYLFRGFADLSWRVVIHRLTGEVPGWPSAYVRGDSVTLCS